MSIELVSFLHKKDVAEGCQSNVIQNEKPSKFFLNLEKQNQVNREIRQLSTENSDTLHKQEDITKEIFNFYSNLYSAKETD